MTPEVRERIFEPFFTTKEMGKGTGLGLSTVYGIVQRSGGHIEVESELNQGTQFRIYLPEAKVVPSDDTAVSNAAAPLRGCETILLAEDEAGIRAMTRAYLEGLGYNVLEAGDGAEAVKVSSAFDGSIDLILTDLRMPIMRGDAVVDAVRKLRPAVKAIYISGSLEDLKADEFAKVLLKPFEFPELGRQVRSILDCDLRLTKAV
jgi:CheY-like chemotaxis protein